MKKIATNLIAIFISFTVCQGQITKGYWVLNGNASISRLKSSSEASLQFSQTDIQISGGVGYFLFDKFAAGIRPSFIYESNSIGSSNSVFGIGPFLRYYFLKPEGILNIISDASYSYGRISGGTKSNSVSLFAGPVVYFNTSVALEILFGYSTSKVVGFDGGNNKFQFAIGFQFHVEKEN